MPRNDLLAFVDLETTGVDEREDEIIEVGVAIYTWPDFNEVYSFSKVAIPSAHGIARMNQKDTVREMHKANGLLDDILHERGTSIEHIDELLDRDLLQFGSRGSSHIPLAGSGVLHFDRRFIKKYLPLFDARLSHWAYDVGVLRRMFILAGARYADDSGKTHRALDDARVHAEEFKFYMDRITEMFGALRVEADAAKAS